ncbi:glycosyl transferase [Acinetobacter sp. 194]|uniref:glycosyltransferase family 25 protein n=1 Tax=Acinetobacter shaoyimingii TaxID=2715164 RepID=UPI00140CA7F0|nr:glycosyltransferase family 25 protein [Acinetobacter shaoyimingii]NHB58730.1 glycosyl transferase [Acinetobacter shaoyimingii]
MKVVTYLINLEGSAERFSRSKAQLDQVGWSFERFSAYDGRGKSLSDFEDYDDELTQQLLGRRLLNSELGCYLSHVGCVEKFLTTDADYLVVLEDDMKISNDFSRKLNRLLKYLHEHPSLDWYLINIASKKKKLSRDINQFDNFTLWHAFYFPIRGLGLVWSRKGAEEFVKRCRPMTQPVDIFFQSWLSQNGKGLGVWPALVEPDGLDSDILGTVATDKISRKQKENRSRSFEFKKQKRMWRDRMYAVKHLLSNSST